MQNLDFMGKTVLIAGADCPAGSEICAAFVAAGARVVLCGRDERALREAAAGNPERVDHLVMDLLRPRPCHVFGAGWGTEPLDVLVLLQSLAAPERPGAVIAAIPAFCRAFAQGLGAARSPRVVSVFAAPSQEALAEHRAYDRAMQELPTALEHDLRGAGGNIPVHALRISNAGGLKSVQGLAELARTVLWLCAPQAPAIGGAVWPVRLPCD
ncbi:hypothetical protein [Roseovarius pacificus]|uniref:hypothetical protein n=1 Tax=Roseovarius pacificus TaxID=337701 RepID=UPI002A188F5A|nr:hypothetical protein [Roseovarius pacificus]